MSRTEKVCTKQKARGETARLSVASTILTIPGYQTVASQGQIEKSSSDRLARCISGNGHIDCNLSPAGFFADIRVFNRAQKCRLVKQRSQAGLHFRGDDSCFRFAGARRPLIKYIESSVFQNTPIWSVALEYKAVLVHVVLFPAVNDVLRLQERGNVARTVLDDSILRTMLEHGQNLAGDTAIFQHVDVILVDLRKV